MAQPSTRHGLTSRSTNCCGCDHRAQGFSFLPRQPVHSLLTGRHASRLRGRGLDFEELRHYVEGDDTRTIDWAATARLGTPYVRVYHRGA